MNAQQTTNCAGRVLTNTRPHQLRWGDREMKTKNEANTLVLRDNTYSTIQWDTFTQPELHNFIQILQREEIVRVR